MASIMVSQDVKDVLSRINPGEENIENNIFVRGLRDLLRECEQELLDLEIKYGFSYEEFKNKLEKGEFGGQFSYPVETDALRWDDLILEKKARLEVIRSIEKM